MFLDRRPVTSQLRSVQVSKVIYENDVYHCYVSYNNSKVTLFNIEALNANNFQMNN